MSRAQSTQLANLGTTNAKTAGTAALGGYQAEQNAPGYTPAEQTNLTNATEGGIGAAYGSSAEAAANTAARTNNAAGNAASQDALARQRMIASGQTGAQNAVTIANARIAGSQNANAGLGGLYGTSLSGANTAAAASPSFWDQFGSAAAKSLGSFGASMPTPGGGSVGFD